jgi:hypothetical protein
MLARWRLLTYGMASPPWLLAGIQPGGRAWMAASFLAKERHRHEVEARTAVTRRRPALAASKSMVGGHLAG